MRPILLDIELFGSQITLYSYRTFMVLAWIASIAVGTYAASRLGLPWRKTLLLLATSLAIGIVGARVFDLGIASDFYTSDPSRIFALNFSGFAPADDLHAIADHRRLDTLSCVFIFANGKKI